jgi:putative DNA primase/helicase
MSKKLSIVPAVSPRPYLQIVKSLKLTRNQSEVRKSKKIIHQLPSLKSAANDEAIEEGSRNNILFSLAGSMLRRGMSKDAILAALIQENISRCSPPLEQEEILAIATGITRYTPVSSDELLRSFTDMGNATRFMKSYSGKVIYISEMGWFIWNGLKWKQSQKNIHIMQLAKEVVRDIYLEGESLSDDERIKISKHAKSSQSVAKLKAMIELAQSEPELVQDINAIDAHDMLLGVANGVVDLNKGKLLEPNPENFITRHSPVVFDKDAQCPLFLNFISQITGGDKELINYLQIVMGYCLTGVTKEHCFFFLHGNGANGKSTFLKIISEMLGSDLAIDTPAET